MRGKTQLHHLFRPSTCYSIWNQFFLKHLIAIPSCQKRSLCSDMTAAVADIEINTMENRCDAIETNDPLFPKELLVKYMLEKSDPAIDYGSIYNKPPNAKPAVKGETPEPRLVWEEQDCSASFPASPEEANLDVVHYLEQRDMWERRRILDIPKFCVGSIVAVTRADRWHEQGFSKFMGICIDITTNLRNTKKHSFALRNVILGQALEIRYPFYNPLIQKIEVLRHERWENEMGPGVGLRFLRDYPLEYSTISEKMEAEPYTEEPSVRKWTDEDKEKLRKHLQDIFDSRRPIPPMIR